jgi:hypothetical protein
VGWCAALLLAATVVFVVGVALERSETDSHSETTSHSQTETEADTGSNHLAGRLDQRSRRP